MDLKQKIMVEIILPFFKNLYDINFYERVMYERDIHGQLCVKIIMSNSDKYSFQLKIIREILNSMTVSEVIKYIDALIEICNNSEVEPSYKGFTVIAFKELNWTLEFSEALAQIIYGAGEN